MLKLDVFTVLALCTAYKKHVKQKDTNRLKTTGWKTNTNQKKKWNGYINTRVDFRADNIARNK